MAQQGSCWVEDSLLVTYLEAVTEAALSTLIWKAEEGCDAFSVPASMNDPLILLLS